MRSKLLMTIGVALLPCAAAFGQSMYCPENAGTINTGMTQEQVLKACGQPLSKQQSRGPVTEKVPVQQLIYTALNTGSVYPGLNSMYYDQWSSPSGTSGINLRIDIINGIVTSVSINGSSTNAASVCHGIDIQSGDRVNKVYSACGSPAMVNNTFIMQVVPSNTKPEVWIYQHNQYQSPISLTFVNGKLQSID